MAAACGLGVRRWDLCLGLALGVSVGLALRTAGMLYVFGMLALPALAARQVCRETWQLFILAPLLGLAVAVLGFVAGNYYDIPQAPLSVLLLAAAQPLLALGARVLGCRR
jgi:ABC-type Mn2+/Zn2+ transport system permease subunit